MTLTLKLSRRPRRQSGCFPARSPLSRSLDVAGAVIGIGVQSLVGFDSVAFPTASILTRSAINTDASVVTRILKCEWMAALAMRLAAIGIDIAAPCFRLSHVLLLRAGNKVCRITARRIVAGVKQIQSWWNNTAKKFVHIAMGGVPESPALYASITAAISASRIDPAPIIVGFAMDARPNLVSFHVENIITCR